MGTVRRLAAIMFTDITGYSTLMESDEFRARMIRNRHREVFKETHSRYGGKILQYFGDGTLSIFDSTASAVECAVSMQIEYRKDPEVPLRIGIHTGDIAYDDEGAYGDGLNIASRLEGLCLPGGVFISAKVYDDIKNHTWLAAVSLGYFQLHNISRNLEVFAVTSKDLPYPTSHEMKKWDIQPEYYKEQTARRGSKKKGVAFLLALFFGMWGIHRFYLGQKIWGIIHFVLAMVAFMISVTVDPPFPPIVVFVILGLLDAVLLLAMPKAEFDYKYNGGKAQQSANPYQRVKKENYTLYRPPTREQGDSSIAMGIEFYKKEAYAEALLAFKRALEEDPDSAAAHFNLACCYAILKNVDESYAHLAMAVESGFTDYDRILNHEALSFLRHRDDFKAFQQNGYRIVQQLSPGTAPDTLELREDSRESILDQLEHLGDKLERGELSRDEFDTEKKKLLRP
jgi:class 3 adenylate cyclase